MVRPESRELPSMGIVLIRAGGVGLPLLLLLTLFYNGGEDSLFYVCLANAADLRGGAGSCPFLRGTIAREPAREQASCGGHHLLLLLTLLWG